MKKSFTTVILSLVVFLAFDLNAQIRTPAPSPSAKVEQMVGLTNVTVEYSRPGVKGRTIFAENGLVPFGKVWRTGANSATKITFGDDVTIEGKDLAKGSYAILTKPGASSWDVHFYTYESGNFGTYLEKEPNLVVTVKPETFPVAVENFLVTIGNLKEDGADIWFLWDKTSVPIKLGVHTDKMVMASIDKVMNGPSDGDYYAAGLYYYNSGRDKTKALEYVQKATHVDEPRFWQLRWEAEILHALGKTKEAIAVAKKSMELAETAGNNDYVKINKDNIAKWGM